MRQDLRESNARKKIRDVMIETYHLQCLEAVVNHREIPPPPTLPGPHGYHSITQQKKEEEVKVAAEKRRAELRYWTLATIEGHGKKGEEYSLEPHVRFVNPA